MNDLCVEISDFSNPKLIGSNVGLFSDEELCGCGSVAQWEIDSALLTQSYFACWGTEMFHINKDCILYNMYPSSPVNHLQCSTPVRSL